MIKVTLEFLTVDAAIVALAKINAPLPKPAAGANDDAERQQHQAGAGGKKERKPRADKGQERGPHKNAGGGTSQPPQAAAAPQASAPAPAPATTAPGTATAPVAGGEVRDLPPATTAPSKVGEQPANSIATTAAPSAAVVPTLEAAQDALSKVFEMHGLGRSQEVLQRYGVTRLRDLLPEQRAAFIKEATEVASKK